jgi:hypothetical protein
LSVFRDNVVAHSWDGYDANEREIQTEEMLYDVINSFRDLQALAFDVGADFGIFFVETVSKALDGIE